MKVMCIVREFNQVVSNGRNMVHLSDCIGHDFYIQSLLVAISHINRNSIVSNGELMTEPSFCAELKSKWDSLLIQHNPQDLKVLYDQTKHLNCHNIRPDLVLHFSQETCERNHTAIEVKKVYQDIDKIKEDFRRLCIYMSKDTIAGNTLCWKSFAYGVFIIIGKRNPLNKIKINKECIKKVINEHRDKFCNIICIGYDGKKIKCDTLDNI